MHIRFFAFLLYASYTFAAPAILSRGDSLYVMNASYKRKAIASQGDEPSDLVDATFTTTIPSINLNNFPIDTVLCDFNQSSVSAIFLPGADTSHILTSVPVTATEFMLLIDGTLNCNPNKPGYATWVHATSMSKIDDITVEFKNATITKASNYLESYKFVLESLATPEVTTDAANTNFTRRANPGEVSIAFGPTSQDAAPLKLIDGLSVACRGCESKATLKLKVEIDAKPFKKPIVKMNVQGLATAGVGLHFTLSGGGSVLAVSRIPLFSVPISPFDIPGIISIGPQFGVFLDASLSVGAKAELDIGFDFTTGTGTIFDVNAEASEDSPKDNKGSEKNFKPSLKFRPTKIGRIEGSVTGSVAVFPEFSVGIEILEKNIFGLGVKFVNDLSATVTAGVSVSTADNCPVKVDLHAGSRLEGFIGNFFTTKLATFADADIFSSCVLSS